MPKFIVLNLKRGSVSLEFEDVSREEAKKTVAKYMTGKGLPMKNERSFALYEQVEGCEFLWTHHAPKDVLGSSRGHTPIG